MTDDFLTPERIQAMCAQATLRILSSAEIQALSSQADFAQAAAERITTMDLRPIDNAAAMCRAAFESSPWLPVFEFRSTLIHRPVPEEFRRFASQAKWEGYSEPIGYDVRGVLADGCHLLHFTSATGKPRSSLWGISGSSSALIYHRGLPLIAASMVTPERLAAAAALQEAADISESTPSARHSDRPRI